VRLPPSALFGLMAIDIQRVNAGSAVAIEPHHGNLTTAYGGPVAREKQLALPTLANFSAATATIRRFRRGRLWPVGVAAHGKKALIAAALGRKSATEAQSVVLSQLTKAGGANPKIITRWRG
jgi:hypothetical protein